MDLLAGAAWAAGLVLAHGVLGDLLAATTELDRARGARGGRRAGRPGGRTVTLIAPPVRGEPRPPALP